MWSNFFRDGGFGMFPTLIVGILLLAAAIWLVIKPEKRFLPLTYSLGLFTLVSGVLGTTVGVINTFRHLQNVPQADQFKVVALGCAESLNNLAFALLILGVTALLGGVASVRGMKKSVA